MGWSKSILDWTEGTTAYMSVVFTWDLPKAFSRAVWYKQQGYDVQVGGTAIKLLPDYLKPVAMNGGNIPCLQRHNPEATRTSLGCPNKCEFCGVQYIEPEFEELTSWLVAPIICDNNLTACSHSHFGKVVDSVKPLRNIDINQGLDARLFRKWHLDRLRELSLYKLRFSWDYIGEEKQVMDTLNMVINSGFPKSKLHIYVLFNHKDSPQEALYKCETLWNMGVVPNVQRFQPLDCLIKNKHIDEAWTKELLADFTLYWSRRHLPLETHRVLRLRELMNLIRRGDYATETINQTGI